MLPLQLVLVEIDYWHKVLCTGPLLAPALFTQIRREISHYCPTTVRPGRVVVIGKYRHLFCSDLSIDSLSSRYQLAPT